MRPLRFSRLHRSLNPNRKLPNQIKGHRKIRHHLLRAKTNRALRKSSRRLRCHL